MKSNSPTEADDVVDAVVVGAGHNALMAAALLAGTTRRRSIEPVDP
jgi:UDP-N-acetylglucosamine enolpyruvyl transferase